MVVTNNQAQADYIVLLDHEGGKNWFKRDNKVAVFSKAGDVIFSRSVRMLGNAVDEACGAILRHAPVPSVNAVTGPQKEGVGLPPANLTVIALGMSISSVEVLLGPPAVKVNLGDKVLYKYKDMTVEFRDGKVSDVR